MYKFIKIQYTYIFERVKEDDFQNSQIGISNSLLEFENYHESHIYMCFIKQFILNLKSKFYF